MSAIKPPGGPGGVGTPAPSTDRLPDSGAVGGASFQEKITQSRDPAALGSVSAADPSQLVLADLRSGRISPSDALHRLTDLAVQRSGAPASMRPAVEAQLRTLLSQDPLLQSLVQQMGATLSNDK